MWCNVSVEGQTEYGTLDYALIKGSSLTYFAPTDVPYLVIVDAKLSGINEREAIYQLATKMSVCSEGPDGKKNTVRCFF